MPLWIFFFICSVARAQAALLCIELIVVSYRGIFPGQSPLSIVSSMKRIVVGILVGYVVRFLCRSSGIEHIVVSTLLGIRIMVQMLVAMLMRRI